MATQDPIVIEDFRVIGYLSVTCLNKGRFTPRAILFDCKPARKFGQD